jgi:hypothetical protein
MYMNIRRQRATVLAIFLTISILTGIGLNAAFAWIGHSQSHHLAVAGISTEHTKTAGY